jgi:hypothetical protein
MRPQQAGVCFGGCGAAAAADGKMRACLGESAINSSSSAALAPFLTRPLNLFKYFAYLDGGVATAKEASASRAAPFLGVEWTCTRAGWRNQRAQMLWCGWQSAERRQLGWRFRSPPRRGRNPGAGR